MKKYQVIITNEAENDLLDVFRYIALELLEPTIARNLCDSIEEEIVKLNSMPDRHALYKHEPWFSRGLRFFPVGNYLVFYIVRDSDNTVHVLRIMYSGRNVQRQL
jgi:toxin ParE1/3/4